MKPSSPALKMTALTLGFYFLTSVVIYLLEKVSPSGPCTPGLGILSFFVAIPVAMILFCLNLYKIVMGETQHTGSMVVHFIAIAGVMMYSKAV
jgi:hypothetical protein